MYVREVIDPGDPAIEAFGRIQRAAYFEPGSLIPPEWFGRLLADQGSARRNFFVVAEEDDSHAVLGGTIFHYLAAADSGFSSFMGVDRAARGRGIARALHRERFTLLNRAAGHDIPGVFIDVVNPARMEPHELEADRAAGMDSVARLPIFQQLGFGRVDIRYEQPVGGPGGGPVTKLDLLYCPQQQADTVPTELVMRTMCAYWTPWMGKKQASYFARELEQRANGRRTLLLLPPVP